MGSIDKTIYMEGTRFKSADPKNIGIFFLSLSLSLSLSQAEVDAFINIAHTDRWYLTLTWVVRRDATSPTMVCRQLILPCRCARASALGCPGRLPSISLLSLHLHTSSGLNYRSHLWGCLCWDGVGGWWWRTLLSLRTLWPSATWMIWRFLRCECEDATLKDPVITRKYTPPPPPPPILIKHAGHVHSLVQYI